MKALLAAVAIAALALPAAAQVKVAAVNGPLAEFAAAIGGDAVEVLYPVPEGTDPALWRPSIAQIGEIQAADLILLNGADFAAWTAKTSLPRARVLVTSAGFRDAYIETQVGVTHSHGDAGEHSHTGLAPLTWMDFGQAALQAEAIAGRLARLAPEARSEIEANAAELGAALQALDAQARVLGETLAGQAVIADHPGFEYFARGYGIEMRALDWAPAFAPDDAARAALAAAVAETGATVFLWQAAPSEAGAAAVSEAGLRGVVLAPGADAAQGFVARMQAGLDALAAAVE